MQNAFETNKRPSAATSRRLELVSLFLIAATIWIAFGHLQSGEPFSDRSAALGASWYLRSGQWRADLRTLIAAVSYVMDHDEGAQPKKVFTATALPSDPSNLTTTITS